MNFFANFLPPQTRVLHSPQGEDHNGISIGRICKTDPRSDAHKFLPNVPRGPATIRETVVEESPVIPNEIVPQQEYEIKFSRNEPFPHEKLLIKDIHYNPHPYTPEGENLPSPPEWVIISSDPDIMHLLPINCGDAQGLIIYRGQATIESGTLVIHEYAPKIYPTIEEIERGFLDLRLYSCK
ncbi:hypothetical protein GPJ56_005004 [Histomonas meleagridis]|uniref:uncharacterized protein n=1 Tax=Histomonas meleagridis TaxID=135588 RepID=UPI00355AB64B|nr:hypothetical protein GPJ56_005004 [Histomonas meleagridis]KAH0805906.1 hypothetical protein GO595_001294 [Histomonas meleagridis]